MDPRAFDVRHGDDRRRVWRGEEEVEGVGHHLADAIGEAHRLEVVEREAGLAHALARELERLALAALLALEAHVFVALAEVDGGRQTRIAALRPLDCVEAARSQILVIAADRSPSSEVPADTAPRSELLDVLGGFEGQCLRAIAVCGDE